MAVRKTIKRSSAADDILLTDAFEEFMIAKSARNLSDATLHNYRYSFKKFLDFIKKDNADDTENTKDLTCSTMEVGILYKWIATMKNDGVKHISISSYSRLNSKQPNEIAK